MRASARASLRAAGGGRGRAALSPRAQTPDGPRRAGRAAQGAVLPAAQRDRAALPREQAAAVHGARPPCAAQRAPPRSPSTSCRGSGPRSAAGAPAHSASALALEEVYPLRMGTWSQGWPEAARARARQTRLAVVLFFAFKTPHRALGGLAAPPPPRAPRAAPDKPDWAPAGGAPASLSPALVLRRAARAARTWVVASAGCADTRTHVDAGVCLCRTLAYWSLARAVPRHVACAGARAATDA